MQVPGAGKKGPGGSGLLGGGKKNKLSPADLAKVRLSSLGHAIIR